MRASGSVAYPVSLAPGRQRQSSTPGIGWQWGQRTLGRVVLTACTVTAAARLAESRMGKNDTTSCAGRVPSHLGPRRAF